MTTPNQPEELLPTPRTDAAKKKFTEHTAYPPDGFWQEQGEFGSGPITKKWLEDAVDGWKFSAQLERELAACTTVADGGLLPCPFCGHNKIMELGNMYAEDFKHQCLNCKTTSGRYRTKPEAIKAWNTRTTPPRVEAEFNCPPVCPVCHKCHRPQCNPPTPPQDQLEEKLNEIVEKWVNWYINPKTHPTNYAASLTDAITQACRAYSELKNRELVSRLASLDRQIEQSNKDEGFRQIHMKSLEEDVTIANSQCDQLKQQLEELTKLPMPLPPKFDEPFYAETMGQAEWLNEISCHHPQPACHKFEGVARKLKYMAQAFTCTANFMPIMLERDKLKKELKDIKILLLEKNETANTFMNQVKKLQAQLAALKEGK